MASSNYRVSYSNQGSMVNPNMQNGSKYQTKLTQMSINYASELERYTRPEIPTKNEIKYNYEQFNNPASMVSMNIPSNYDRNDYPASGTHSRFPVLVNCDHCNALTMTDIEYEHGCASKTWCFLLLPFFCTGFCCLCLNSCKDVKHSCSSCRKDMGICKSKCI